VLFGAKDACWCSFWCPLPRTAPRASVAPRPEARARLDKDQNAGHTSTKMQVASPHATCKSSRQACTVRKSPLRQVPVLKNLDPLSEYTVVLLTALLRLRAPVNLSHHLASNAVGRTSLGRPAGAGTEKSTNTRLGRRKAPKPVFAQNAAPKRDFDARVASAPPQPQSEGALVGSGSNKPHVAWHVTTLPKSRIRGPCILANQTSQRVLCNIAQYAVPQITCAPNYEGNEGKKPRFTPAA
jgi:hypothetical protein